MSPRNPLSQRHQESVWIMEDGLDAMAVLTNRLDAVLTRIERRLSEFNMIRSRLNSAYIVCLLTLECDNIYVDLRHELLSRIAKMGVNLEFDIYYVGEDEEKNGEEGMALI